MPTADADADPDSDSDKEHPLHEPEFVFHAVDIDGERRQIHHRPRTAADVDREERLRAFMISPRVFLCGVTFIFVCLMIYLANNPEARADFNWDVLVMTSSALVMIFSLLSLLLSYLGVYYFDGWLGLNRYLP